MYQSHPGNRIQKLKDFIVVCFDDLIDDTHNRPVFKFRAIVLLAITEQERTTQCHPKNLNCQM